MANHILKCPVCDKYTLREQCHAKTITPLPPKLSLEDKYGKYRREARRKELMEKGWM